MRIGADGREDDLLLAGRGLLDVDDNVLLGDRAAGRIDAQRGVAFDVAGDAVGVAVRLDEALEIPAAGARGVHLAGLAAVNDEVDELFGSPLLPERLGQAALTQAVVGQLENGLENSERLVHHNALIFVDLRGLDAGVVGAVEHVPRRPAGLAHGVAGRDADALGRLRTVEVGAAELGGDGHAGEVRLLRDQVRGRVLERFGNNDQALGEHVVAERAHDGKVTVQVVAADVHLDAGELPGQTRMVRKAFGKEAHGNGHAVGAADVVDVLVGVELREDLVLGADDAGLVTVDDLRAEVVDAAAAEVDVDDRADVGAVKTGDEAVEDVDVRGVAGGVDTHGVLGAAAHLDELALALRGDAALTAGLLDELAALERVDVAGRLGVDELEHGLAELFGVLVNVVGFLPGLFGAVAAEDRVQAGHAGLDGLLAELVDAVAAADDTGDLAGIRRGQTDDLAVLVKIGHLDAEAVRIGADGLDVFLNNSFGSFLRVFHSHCSSPLYIPYLILSNRFIR